MTFRSWIRGLCTRTPRTLRKAPARVRPCFEELESRLVPSFTLGTSALLEGPAAGTASDIVTGTGSWSATTNAAWLHTTASGTDNGLAIFSLDANTGATRSGTLTVAGQTLTVTQAGSNYVAPTSLTTLVSGLNTTSVAVDSSGNVFIADSAGNAIDEWFASFQMLFSIDEYGLKNPTGIAVDSAGNVFIADSGDNAIKEWNTSTARLGTIVSSGLNNPTGVAVDSAGNLYIVDSGNNAVEEWNASTQTLGAIVSSGLNNPTAVAVDSSGNVYIANGDDNNRGNNAIEEWNASTQTVSVVVSGLNKPIGVAVDSAGNLYITDSGLFNGDPTTIKEWNASTQTVSVVPSGLYSPTGVAVDSSGNLYVPDSNADVGELPRAFVPVTANETATAGSDVLPVLPATQSLTGVFAPTSDQAWLTIGSLGVGTVNFSFTGNTGAPRTAVITALGLPITVAQAAGRVYPLIEGPAAGSDSYIVTYSGPWTAVANAGWLHTTSSGTGNGLAYFTFDANTGPTRTGTLTIAGQTLTVTQEGSNFVAGTLPITLVSSGLNSPSGVAVDSSGNVYIADEFNHAIKVWNASTHEVSTLISSGLGLPKGVAVDNSGNVFIADRGNGADGSDVVEEWNASTRILGTIASGLAVLEGVAVDSSGNVLFCDTLGIQEWSAATRTIVATWGGMGAPDGLAVDSSGNIYTSTATPGLMGIQELNPSTGAVSTIVSSGLTEPVGVAVDGSGNLYIADQAGGTISEFNASTQELSTLVSSVPGGPAAVAVDGAGNVYFVDGSAIKELPRAGYIPAVVVTNPSSQTAGSGETVTFTAVARGFPAPAVQWLMTAKGSTNFQPLLGNPSATTAALTLLADPADNGNQYEAVFTSAGSSATTKPATLTVAGSVPAVLTSPTNQTATAGKPVTFMAQGSGSPTPVMHWQVSVDDGNTWSNIAGGGNGKLTFTALAGDNGFQYRAVFSNRYGIAQTAAATLTVTAASTTAPSITTQPTAPASAVNAGQRVTLKALASDAGAVQWQMSSDGVTFTNIAGATATTYAFTAQASENGYQYVAVFTNPFGPTTTHVVTLAVNSTITTQPAAQTVYDGQTLTFTAAATGNALPTVQWQSSSDGKTFTNIMGANSANLTFAASLADTGLHYRAVFTSTSGTVTTQSTSKAVVLTVHALPAVPVVTMQPVNQISMAGRSVTFTAVAVSNPAVTSIQWQVRARGSTTFVDLPGQTSGTLTFVTAATDNGSQYRAVFSNGHSVNTAAATLTLGVAPVVSLQPASQNVAVGKTVTFTAAASGAPTASIQWQVSTDGGETYQNIAGATGLRLTFTAGAQENGNYYRAVFTNPLGQVMTDAALLTI